MTDLKGTIISGFPGVGKSYAIDSLTMRGFKVSDSDSSLYSWIYDDDGNKTDVRNPNFVDDYLNHIITAAKANDIVFVSTHKEIRTKLKEEGIEFYTVAPRADLKDEYLMRYVDRGSPAGLIRGIIENWDSLIRDVKDTAYSDLYIELKENEYLLDGFAFDPYEELDKIGLTRTSEIGIPCAKEILYFYLDEGDIKKELELAQSIRKNRVDGLGWIPMEEGDKVFEEIEGTSRWSIHGTRVYKRTRNDGSEVFIEEKFSEGATEYQEDDPSEFAIVKPHTITITKTIYK